MALLTGTGLCRHYGGVTALAGVSLQVEAGETVGVIGSNGAGKTTLFQLLTAFERPDAGTIRLHTQGGEIAVHTMPAHRLARMGVGRTFQNLRLFERLTVRENIQSAVFSLGITGFSLDELLERLSLVREGDVAANELPYGARKMCELGRAVTVASGGCGLLFLDEPCAGLSAGEAERLSLLLRQLKERFRLTLFIIEHHMAFLEGLCDRL
ncbi:MAG: ABC transporter ATP-binding protein, partial [Acetanaerobacterium sp.]